MYCHYIFNVHILYPTIDLIYTYFIWMTHTEIEMAMWQVMTKQLTSQLFPPVYLPAHNINNGCLNGICYY